MERGAIYFNVDKVKSKKKIGFIHNNYNEYPYDYKLDKEYFQYYTKIATVSENCKIVLENIFPEYKNKFLVIKNMVSKSIIEELSEEELNLIKTEKCRIVTVGRLVEQKGIDKAIDICKKLIDNSYDIKWYVVGSGQDEIKLSNKIIELRNSR